MSTLTYTLILLAAVILLAVAGLNLWQSFRTRDRQRAGSSRVPSERAFRRASAQPEGPRGEPSLQFEQDEPLSHADEGAAAHGGAAFNADASIHADDGQVHHGDGIVTSRLDSAAGGSMSLPVGDSTAVASVPLTGASVSGSSVSAPSVSGPSIPGMPPVGAPSTSASSAGLVAGAVAGATTGAAAGAPPARRDAADPRASIPPQARAHVPDSLMTPAPPAGRRRDPAPTEAEPAPIELDDASLGIAPRGLAALLDETADCIVPLRLPTAQAGERLLGMARSMRRVGAKPVGFEGRGNPADPTNRRWGALKPGQAYSEVRVGVLLANRHGPLNAMEYSDFTSGLTQVAQQLSVNVRMPELSDVLDRARQLDAACVGLDAQIGLNVDCNEPLSPADLERIAREQQLVERGNNRYARLGPNEEVLFSVSHVDAPNRLTYLLDVPRAPAGLQPWEMMVVAAIQAAHRLQGVLVDDAGRPLSEAALASISHQLAHRYHALEQAGIPAGSSTALRLFN